MIIELQNFGPIKSFKFDTDKDIHAIFGKNNIGKSYAISAVYLILKGLRATINHKFESVLSHETVLDEENITEIENLIEQNIPIDVNIYFRNALIDILNKTFVESLNASFQNTFNLNYLENNTDSPLAIKIFLEDIFIKIIFSKNENKFLINEIYFSSDVSVIIGQNKRTIIHRQNGKNLRTLIITTRYSLPTEVFYSCLFSLTKKSLWLFENVYLLPASRSGIYNTLSSFGVIFAEISRNRNYLTSKFEIPSTSEPISDYFLNLSNTDKTQTSEYYLKHFEEIEQEILQGQINLDNETKKYYYTPNNSGMRLDLSFTSSMISEIALIIAHLKYIIPLNSEFPSILFIEEPEAHLHPEVQILLLEYFVKLSKGNLKIVMTSHSNYIFNKLSNMVISKEISPDRLSVSLMKMTPEGSIVEEGAMQMDEYGIEDNNFVDVAEQLYEERMKLLENINQ